MAAKVCFRKTNLDNLAIICYYDNLPGAGASAGPAGPQIHTTGKTVLPNISPYPKDNAQTLQYVNMFTYHHANLMLLAAVLIQ